MKQIIAITAIMMLALVLVLILLFLGAFLVQADFFSVLFYVIGGTCTIYLMNKLRHWAF